MLNNELNLKTIKIDYCNYILTEVMLKTIEEVNDWFSYSTIFKNKTIITISDCGDYVDTYKSFDDFIDSWIITLKEAMGDAYKIDYSDWIELFNEFKVTNRAQ